MQPGTCGVTQAALHSNIASRDHLYAVVNCHQLNLNRSPLPPVKRKTRSWVPVAPVTGHVTLAHDCQPPVALTAQVPTSVPVGLPMRSSMLPPAEVAEATRAVKDVGPAVPKATPLTLM